MEKYYLYVLLTRTNTIISKLIHNFTNDQYTHAAISLDKDLSRMYSFGRKYTKNPFLGRFRKETLDTGVYKFHKNLPGLIMEIEVTKQQYQHVESMINHFIENKDLYKYNYPGLIYGLFNKETHYEHRFLCSEFVYYLLNESSIVDFHLPRNLIRPQNLLDLHGTIIYEGNLKEIEFENNSYPLNGLQPMRFSSI